MPRKSKATAERKVSEVTGLALPFPSAPSHPGQYVLYVRTPNDGTQVFVTAAPYAARKIFDAVVANDKLNHIDEEQVETDTGIVLRSSELEAIVDHEYTPEEAEWELPIPYPRALARIRALATGEAMPERKGATASNDDAPTDNPGKPAKKSKKTPKAPGEKRATKRKVADGAVTIAQISDELGMSPREARGILRATKTSKPDGGWAWPANEVEGIKKLLQKNKKK